eukprot:s1523_g5.t1
MLTQLKLRNESNFCYCNALMCCLWWTILNRIDYHHGDWGSGERAMQMFFSWLSDAPKSVQEGFPSLFTMWNNGNLPADAAEFAYCVISWMNTPCISHKWGRYYLIENQRFLHDHGDASAPIFLQVPDPSVTSVCLQDLITRWTQEYGMQTALYSASDVLLCHVDRNANHADGSLFKLQFWLHADHVCSFPVFDMHGNQVHHDYAPVAMLAHLGDLSSGHYRAALRMTAGDGDQSLSTHHTVWGLTDDNVPPQTHPLPGMPEWLCRNTTLVCLVRLAKLDLFRPLQDPGAGWMRLRELRSRSDPVETTDNTFSLPPGPDSGPSAVLPGPCKFPHGFGDDVGPEKRPPNGSSNLLFPVQQNAPQMDAKPTGNLAPGPKLQASEADMPVESEDRAMVQLIDPAPTQIDVDASDDTVASLFRLMQTMSTP